MVAGPLEFPNHRRRGQCRNLKRAIAEGAGHHRHAAILPFFSTLGGGVAAIGSGHLLPEAQHHDRSSGPRLVLLAAVGAGIVLAIRALAG